MLEAKVLRTKSLQELTTDLIELRKRQFQLRILRGMDQLSNVAEFSTVRKDIARIKTVMTEKRASKDSG